jgi:hypothetical protein
MPSVHSLASLRESFQHDAEQGKADSWLAEMMNDPNLDALSLLTAPLPLSNISTSAYSLSAGDVGSDGIEFFDGSCIIVDPAGMKKTSDDNVVIVAKRIDQTLYVVDFKIGKLSPDEVVRAVLEFYLVYEVSLISVEEAGYQFVLELLIKKELDALAAQNIISLEGLTLKSVKPRGRTKESRIRASVKSLYERNVYLHNPAIYSLYHSQAGKYRVGVKDNKDDLLDAVAYLEDIRAELMPLLVRPMRSILQHKGRAFAAIPF